jgi:predicted nuclease of predicted toxin-antitoxin system
MARLYADENFDHPVVDALRQLGHNVLTAQEGGQANQKTPDAEVLAFAIRANRAVISFNRRHFMQLHLRTPSHSGIIVCTRDPDVHALAARIDQQISTISSLANLLIRVNRPNP